MTSLSLTNLYMEPFFSRGSMSIVYDLLLFKVQTKPGYRLQTTIDFLIHLSYKTGHFGGLYKIP